MPKLPPVTCRICHKKVDRSNMIEVASRQYVCQECKPAWDEKQDQKKLDKERDKRFRDGIEKKQKSDDAKLKDEIWNALGKPANYNWIRYSIWLKATLRDGCTVNGLRYTLQYIKENGIHFDGVQQLRWYYDEAREYLSWKKKMRETVSKSKYGCGETVVVDRCDIDREDVFD